MLNVHLEEMYELIIQQDKEQDSDSLLKLTCLEDAPIIVTSRIPAEEKLRTRITEIL